MALKGTIICLKDARADARIRSRGPDQSGQMEIDLAIADKVAVEVAAAWVRLGPGLACFFSLLSFCLLHSATRRAVSLSTPLRGPCCFRPGSLFRAYWLDLARSLWRPGDATGADAAADLPLNLPV